MLPADFYLPARFGPMLPNGRNSRDPQSVYDAYRKRRNSQTAIANRTQPGLYGADQKAGTQPNFLRTFLTSQLPTK